MSPTGSQPRSRTEASLGVRGHAPTLKRAHALPGSSDDPSPPALDKPGRHKEAGTLTSARRELADRAQAQARSQRVDDRPACAFDCVRAGDSLPHAGASSGADRAADSGLAACAFAEAESAPAARADDTLATMVITPLTLSATSRSGGAAVAIVDPPPHDLTAGPAVVHRPSCSRRSAPSATPMTTRSRWFVAI